MVVYLLECVFLNHVVVTEQLICQSLYDPQLFQQWSFQQFREEGVLIFRFQHLFQAKFLLTC